MEFEEKLKDRVSRYLDESGARITHMCVKLHMSTSAFSQWRRNVLNLSPERLLSIDDYLRRWGY